MTKLIDKLRNLRPPPLLPESFLFGVGNSDHQCESYDPLYEDVHDAWERGHGKTARGRATDFWNRYREDIGLAQSLGCRAFRFSISWARVEPAPGQYNAAAFDHYRSLLAAVRAANMEPVITLHHFVWPLHVQARGGLIADDFPQIFARYVAEVVKQLGQPARYWITFNEPNILLFGFIKPWWEKDYFLPPGLPPESTQVDEIQVAARVMRNLFLAHTAARAEIKRLNPQAQVGANPSLTGMPPWLQQFPDRTVMRQRRLDDWIKHGEGLAERKLLAQGKVDAVLATLTLTPERAKAVDFSEVYYVAGQTFLVKAESQITGLGDLTSQAVAVVKSSTSESAVSRLLPQARVQVVADYQRALNALDTGQVVALMADDTILHGLMQQRPGRYRLTGDRLMDEPYAVAVVKGNPLWLDVVDGVVRHFKESGAWAASFAKYFPNQSVAEPPRQGVRPTLAGPSEQPRSRPGPLPLAPPHTLLRRIQERGHLKVAVKRDVPGLSYCDPQTGQWSGLEIDLARALAQTVFGDPDRVEFRPVQTRERLPLVRSPLSFLDPVLKFFSILFTVLNSNWWHLGMAGKLPEFLCPPECVGQQDFIGFDYYWGLHSFQLHRLEGLFSAVTTGRYDRAPVWAPGLYNTIKAHAELFPGKEILIIENGCVPQADGVDRADYVRRHIQEVQRACRQGFRVVGYFCWSITSNREWGNPFGPGSDFGLYHIDLDNDPDLKRMPTEAVAAYREIIAHRGISPAD